MAKVVKKGEPGLFEIKRFFLVLYLRGEKIFKKKNYYFLFKSLASISR